MKIKHLIWVLSLIALFPALASCTSKENKPANGSPAAVASDTTRAKSLAAELLGKTGILLQKDFYEIGRLKGITYSNPVDFQVLIITNLDTKEKLGCLRVKVEDNYYNSTSIGTLDLDEISGCITSLTHFKTAVSQPLPDHYMEYEYYSRDGVKLYIYSNNSDKDPKWVFGLRSDRHTSRSASSHEIDKIDAVIGYMQQAKARIEALIK